MTGTAELRARAGGRDVKRIVFSREQIAERAAGMGRDITAAYPDGEDLLVLGLLQGSCCFVADLGRGMERPVTVDFMGAWSYGAGTVSSGKVDLVDDPTTGRGEHQVLLVEDISDGGTTRNRLVPLLRSRGPKSLEL